MARLDRRLAEEPPADDDGIAASGRKADLIFMVEEGLTWVYR
jgi:hypothetical protein